MSVRLKNIRAHLLWSSSLGGGSVLHKFTTAAVNVIVMKIFSVSRKENLRVVSVLKHIQTPNNQLGRL